MDAVVIVHSNVHWIFKMKKKRKKYLSHYCVSCGTQVDDEESNICDKCLEGEYYEGFYKFDSKQKYEDNEF